MYGNIKLTSDFVTYLLLVSIFLFAVLSLV